MREDVGWEAFVRVQMRTVLILPAFWVVETLSVVLFSAVYLEIISLCIIFNVVWPFFLSKSLRRSQLCEPFQNPSVVQRQLYFVCFERVVRVW